MRNGIVLGIEKPLSRISYDAPLNTYNERPSASRHVLHAFSGFCKVRTRGNERARSSISQLSPHDYMCLPHVYHTVLALTDLTALALPRNRDAHRTNEKRVHICIERCIACAGRRPWLEFRACEATISLRSGSLALGSVALPCDIHPPREAALPTTL